MIRITTKKIFVAFIIFCVALLGITWLVGSFFIDYAIKKGNDKDPMAPPKGAAGILTAGLQAPKKPTYKNENWNIKLGEEKRVATAFFASQPTDKWIIMVHGYCRDQRYVWNYAEEYLNNGFNVLTPDLNASGGSDGQYLTMGVREGKDVSAWAQLVAQKFSKAKIVLHGVSMGAATVMLATQEALPENVFAVIEDCGYTSAYDMFGMQMKKTFGLPSFPILNMVDVVQKIKLGSNMSDASPIGVVNKTKLPMLFVHGSDDELVPLQMMETLYAASTSRIKGKLIIKGAPHAESINTDKDKYFEHVFAFIKKAEP